VTGLASSIDSILGRPSSSGGREGGRRREKGGRIEEKGEGRGIINKFKCS
jgi:hypothetical protein